MIVEKYLSYYKFRTEDDTDKKSQAFHNFDHGGTLMETSDEDHKQGNRF